MKPKVKLVGENGNIFNLIGIACRELKLAGQAYQAKEMTSKVFAAKSYDQALYIISENVENSRM